MSCLVTRFNILSHKILRHFLQIVDANSQLFDSCHWLSLFRHDIDFCEI
jgi:hypothetical protein